ncbi:MULTISPECIES: hypothetical protein [Actinosynnema]|uniref:hypothetical protein n=1 Tax=Actinosynnema TaxID=40566 RepID=UPI0020A39AC8|nr:hypothetical protein [Actinosynnema pretiosum]MCP2094337.1 hypothetical protein [Actinosynnema pretiosum]
MRLLRASSTMTGLATAVALAALAGAALSPVDASAGAAAAPIAPELTAQIAGAGAGEPVRAMLMLPNVAEPGGGGHDAVVAGLREHAARSQAEVVRRPEDHGVTVLNRLWPTNALVVEFPAAPWTLDALAEVPSVSRVIPDFESTLPDVVESADGTAQARRTRGLDRIEAARAWQAGWPPSTPATPSTPAAGPSSTPPGDGATARPATRRRTSRT